MLPPWSCQCSWDFSSRTSVCQIFPAIMEILIYCISSSIFEIMVLCISSSWRFWDSLYCTWRWPHMLYCIMPIHGHCILMYPRLLYVFVVMCKVVLLYYADWVVGLPFGILHHSTSGMDLYCILAIVWPLWPHTFGGICYSWFYYTRSITLVWPSPVPLQTP